MNNELLFTIMVNILLVTILIYFVYNLNILMHTKTLLRILTS